MTAWNGTHLLGLSDEKVGGTKHRASLYFKK